MTYTSDLKTYNNKYHSNTSKVMLNIIRRRLRLMSEYRFSETTSTINTGSITSDNTFNLRSIYGKYLHYQQLLYHVFINLTK